MTSNSHCDSIEPKAQLLKQQAWLMGDSPHSWLRAVAQACRPELDRRWLQAQQADAARDPKQSCRRVHYLSMEFLMGRALGNAIEALRLKQVLDPALAQVGQSLAELMETERDAALGNGGLGRLAACFLDSFAELSLPSFGYGLRYEFGMFAQRIENGQQHEVPDDWLRDGSPWEWARPDIQYRVGFGGQVIADGPRRRWVPAEQLTATAYDFVVPAHHHEHVSTLRQWRAAAVAPIDYSQFCEGQHEAANRHRVSADTLNWVLYPDDSTEAGRVLRLKQEAFLVSASVQDLIARHLREGHSLQTLGRMNAIHLNDTHPALAPAELMRVLLDDHQLPWQEAWSITREAISYTNHTLMPEALETWPLRLFQQHLPRHLEIVFEINARFLAHVRQQFPGDDSLLRAVSLIDEEGERRVRMAFLAIVASHRVNGVAQLHSDLMVQTIFKDHARIFPDRFHNVTNGVTPRRWLMQANPNLALVLDRHIGTTWRQNLERLSDLAPLVQNADLQRELQRVKMINKRSLAQIIARDCAVQVSCDAMFDVQVKRIHEYKRQLLNLLGVVARYQAILQQPEGAWTPRVVIIAGKAASAYRRAKQIIQLTHDIAKMVNNDPRVGDRLRLVFLPNYCVSLAQKIIPAADLSQQISTAGTEASGTGNMKFALNGALTLGTWDGANIEMAQAMGTDEMFVFGLRAQAVQQAMAQGYQPQSCIEGEPRLARVLKAIEEGEFCVENRDRYTDLVADLRQRDQYMLMADFEDYLAAQERIDALYTQAPAWTQKVIRNIAGMGRFSSDRTVSEYVDKVWSPASLD